MNVINSSRPDASASAEKKRALRTNERHQSDMSSVDQMSIAHHNGPVFRTALCKTISKRIPLKTNGWARIRQYAKVRHIAMYWLGEATRRSCAEDGPARQRDLQAFESDCGVLALA